MKRFLLLFAIASMHATLMAQPGQANQDSSWKKIYRETPARLVGKKFIEKHRHV